MQVGSTQPFGWNVTFYLQFKRSLFYLFFFSTQSAIFLIKDFWSWFEPNVIIKWSMKVQKSVGSETLREKHWLHNVYSIQHHTFLSDLRIITPTYIQPFQCWHYINFGWLHKSVIHPYQRKYWNILLLVFHYHSTPVKFPKFNLFLSMQLWTFSSQFHRHFYIHQHNCLNLFFFFFFFFFFSLFFFLLI